MSELNAASFKEFYRTLHADSLGGKKAKPFKWQVRLAQMVCTTGWPKVLNMPTAAGKTAVMDIALFALAIGVKDASRRIFFVVDRRIVVDEASERALFIARRLREAIANEGKAPPILFQVARALAALGGGEEPLVVATMRGGTVRDDHWARSPAQPAICCATVDQVGSRLLFRGYGLSSRSWPIHAGLVGHDALLIVDEAHCSGPFVQTATAIAERYHGWSECPLPGSLQVVQMSATPLAKNSFKAEDEDYEELALRFGSPKLASFVLADRKPVGTRKKAQSDGEAQAAGDQINVEEEAPERDSGWGAIVNCMVEQADLLASSVPVQSPVIGIIVNRVRTARRVFRELRKAGKLAVLFTGRVRSVERDALLAKYKKRFTAGSAREGGATLYVVATQCIEVGANLDFDGMVTECASLDAILQRLGRLNRLGRLDFARIVIVARKQDVEGQLAGCDPVYGGALSGTWRFLRDLPRCTAESARGQLLPPPEKPQMELGLFDAPLFVSAKKQKGQHLLEEFVNLSVAALRNVLVKDLRHLCAPVLDAPVLLPSHLDWLCQTEPAPVPAPDISVFLHGPRAGLADVNIVWREDFDNLPTSVWLELAAVCPPAAGELMPVPFLAVQRWLSGDPSNEDDGGDVEGAVIESSDDRRGRKLDASQERSFVRWMGRQGSAVARVDELLPGDTIIVPAGYGGTDEFGWLPESDSRVTDLGDMLSLTARGRALLRFGNTLTKSADTATEEAGDEARAVVDKSPWTTLRQQLFASIGGSGEDGKHDDRAVTRHLQALASSSDAPAWVRASAFVLALDAQRKIIAVEDRSGETRCFTLVASRRLHREKLLDLLGKFGPEATGLYSEDGFEGDLFGGDSALDRMIPLEDHSKGVGATACRFAELCGLPPILVNTLGCGGMTHDIGKVDERFQAFVYGGDLIRGRQALEAGRPMAKSDLSGRSRLARKLAREKSGYPDSARHEVQSVALMEAGDMTTFYSPEEVDAELLLHLVASHHGFCRPFAPVASESDPVQVVYENGKVCLRASSDHGLAAVGSGIDERFWANTRKYGWYGLAWLEAILRLADHRWSEQEQVEV